MRLVVALFIIMLATTAHATKAFLHGNPNISGSIITTGCSAFTGAAALGLDDGCSGAGQCSPAGQAAGICLYDTNAFTETTQTPNHIAFRQSGQSYVNLNNPHVNNPGFVNWNVACVDFACGVDTTHWPFCASVGDPILPCSTDKTGASTGFIDAALYDFKNDPAHLGIGCSSTIDARRLANGSGAAAPYSFNCASSALIQLNGFDITPWCPSSRTGCPAAGGYICIGFEVNDTASGAITTGKIAMTNNHFIYQYTPDPSCASVVAGNTTPFWFKVNEQDNWELDFNHNFLDLGSSAGFTSNGAFNFYPMGSPPPVNFGNSAAGTGQLKVIAEYNLFQNIPFRGILPKTPCNGFYLNYNGVHNLGHNSGGGHAEFYQNGNFGTLHCSGYSQATAWGHMFHFITINNTFWNDVNLTSSLDGFFNSSAANSFAADMIAIDDWQFDLNTLVQNAAPPFIYLQSNISFGITGTQAPLCGSSTTTSSSCFWAQVGDTLQLQGTGCTVPPTLFVMNGTVNATTGVISGNMGGGWLGNCGTTYPPTGTYALSCQPNSCLHDGYVGPTGLTTTTLLTGSSGNWFPPNQSQGTGQDLVGGNLYGGTINSLSVTNGGSGYTPSSGTQIYTAQALTYSSSAGSGNPTGTGATADITVTNGVVTNATIDNGGLVYIPGDVLTWTGGGGSGVRMTFSIGGSQGNGQYVVDFMDINVLNVISNAIDPTGLQFSNPWFSMKSSHNLGTSCGAYHNGGGVPLLPAVSPAIVAPSSTATVGYITGLGRSASNMTGNFYLTGGVANTLSAAASPWVGSTADGYFPGSGC